jgi:hypothetical protein
VMARGGSLSAEDTGFDKMFAWQLAHEARGEPRTQRVERAPDRARLPPITGDQARHLRTPGSHATPLSSTHRLVLSTIHWPALAPLGRDCTRVVTC